MIDAIIQRALAQRFMVILAALGLLAFGIWSTLKLNLAAFPDVTNIQVQVNTQSPGLAAVEVERLITFPVESVMSGLPGVEQVRSVSKTGLSVVTVVFDDSTDTYFARQLVLERLTQAREQIPESIGSPEMGPISTGLGEIYQYELRAAPGLSLDDSTVLASGTPQDGVLELEVAEPVETGNVLLWFTQLPEVSGEYRIEVGQVQLR